MNYSQTIEYLYTQLPMFTRQGEQAYKKDLHNTLALCAALGNPHTQFKSVHIAGTNGKGSTSHALAAILQQAGYKTGLYTSPHIKDFGERIRINGQMIDRQFVIDFVQKTKALASQIQPSFFELTVAMAFDYFAQNKVDIAIIETGLGGLLDSTNVIKPVLSVITNIGMDHVNILGNSLEEIATQKAGIIKKNTPVVIGEYLPQTRPVFEAAAKQQHAPIFFATEQYAVTSMIPGPLLHCHVTSLQSGRQSSYLLDITGSYQSKNLLSILSAKDILQQQGFAITEEQTNAALKNIKGLTGLHGRWEIVQHQPTVILDVAHNADGISQVMQQLSTQYAGTPLHFVLGFVKDKDINHVLSLFPSEASYYFTNAAIPRALPAAELQQIAAAQGLQGNCFPHINAAVQAAKAAASPHDVIMICGSFFIIAELDDVH